MSINALGRTFASAKARVILAIALAAGVGVGISFASDPATTVHTLAQAQTRGNTSYHMLAFAARGGIFMDDDTIDPGTPPVPKKLIALGDRLVPDPDPGSDGCRPDPSQCGATTPLRRALRGFALIAMWPFALITLLYMLITTVGDVAGQRKIEGLIVQIFSVILALLFYPVWDRVIFKDAVLPMVQWFQSSGLATDVLRAANPSMPADQVGSASYDSAGSTPVERLVHTAMSSTPCGAQLEENPFSRGNKLLVCFHNAKLPERVEIISELVAASNGSLTGWIQLADRDTAIQNTLPYVPAFKPYFASRNINHAGGLSPSRGPSLDPPAPPDPSTVAPSGPLGWFTRKIFDTLVGKLEQIEKLIIVIVVWLAWLGFIFTRAFSLVAAPIQFLWSLLPESGSKAWGWFTSHTKLLFKPVSITVGFTLFKAFQDMVLHSDALGTGSAGSALRFAMCIVFCATAFKMKDALDNFSGDVTEVAGTLGNGVKGAVVDVAKVGMAVGGAAVGGAWAAGRFGGGPSSAGQGGSPVVPGGLGGGGTAGADAAATFDRMGGSSGDLSQTGGLPGEVPLRGHGGSLGSRVLRGVVGSGFDAAKKQAWAIADRMPVLGEGTQAFRNTRDEQSRRHAEKTDKDLRAFESGRNADIDETLAGSVNADAAAAAKRAESGYTVSDTSLRPDELGLSAMPSPATVTFTRGNARDQALARGVATATNGMNIVVAVDTNPDGTQSVRMTGGTQKELEDLYRNDANFRQLIDSQLTKYSARKADGVPVFSDLVNKSTGLAEGLMVSAHLYEQGLEERTRRGYISESAQKVGGPETGSALDLALRAADPGITNPGRAHANPREYGAWLNERGDAASRLVYVRRNPSAVAAGTTDADVIMNRVKNAAGDRVDLNDEVAKWRKADGISDPAEKQAIAADVATAFKDVESHYQSAASGRVVTADGFEYGLDATAYVRSSGKTERYVGQVGSELENLVATYHDQARQENDGQDIDPGTLDGIRKFAYDQLRERWESLSPQKPGESAADWEQRLTKAICLKT